MTRLNPAIKIFYSRLIAASKPVKVVRCAAARKLLVNSRVLPALVGGGQREKSVSNGM
jgi:hypothetical protein